MSAREIWRNERGQTLMMAFMVVLVLSILVPMLVSWTRQESKETVKVRRSATAFHLAEAGVDQGIWKLQESANIWELAQTTTVISGYEGATVYSMTFADGRGGNYTIGFSSGPNSGEVTILAKGRDSSTQEIRAIQCVMQEGSAGEFAIEAKNTSSFGAATNVEWGPVIAKGSISSGSKLHPRMMSAGIISPNDTNGSTDPNTDGIQWWSYKQDLPPDPEIDFDFYKSSAQGAGATPSNGCGNNNSGGARNYYQTSAANFKGCDDQSGNVYYIEGNCNFNSGAGGNYIVGDIICTGDLGITGNGGGDGVVNAPVPSQAWVEYGNDWSFYTTNFDTACPHGTYAAAQAADYNPTNRSYHIDDLLIHGFIYTGGSQGLTGGGNARIWGALYSANNTSLSTSNCTLYYDPAVAASIRTTNVIISRKSWKEVAGASWP